MTNLKSILNTTNITDNVFSIRQTNIIKGIACILLLNHHLFYSENAQTRYTSLFTFNGTPIEQKLAVMSRVCVTIFILLSGYGINESFNKVLKKSQEKPIRTIFRSTVRFLWKLWSGFAVVYILFMPWQGLFDRHPYTSVIDFITDFSGFAYFFNSPTMNATWWYMSVALISYIIAPFFKAFMKYKCIAIYCAVICTFLYFFRGNMYIFGVFMIGMLLSEYRVFDNLFKEKQPLVLGCVCLLSIGYFAYMRNAFVNLMDLVLALSIIVFSVVCISKIKVINSILEFIGKHSTNIFLFHTFLYAQYFTKFVYAPKYAPLILPIFLVECLLVSMLIEFIKKKTFVQKGIDFISKKIIGA